MCPDLVNQFKLVTENWGRTLCSRWRTREDLQSPGPSGWDSVFGAACVMLSSRCNFQWRRNGQRTEERRERRVKAAASPWSGSLKCHRSVCVMYYVSAVTFDLLTAVLTPRLSGWETLQNGNTSWCAVVIKRGGDFLEASDWKLLLSRDEYNGGEGLSDLRPPHSQYWSRRWTQPLSQSGWSQHAACQN